MPFLLSAWSLHSFCNHTVREAFLNKKCTTFFWGHFTSTRCIYRFPTNFASVRPLNGLWSRFQMYLVTSQVPYKILETVRTKQQTNYQLTNVHVVPSCVFSVPMSGGGEELTRGILYPQSCALVMANGRYFHFSTWIVASLRLPWLANQFPILTFHKLTFFFVSLGELSLKYCMLCVIFTFQASTTSLNWIIASSPSPGKHCLVAQYRAVEGGREGGREGFWSGSAQ